MILVFLWICSASSRIDGIQVCLAEVSHGGRLRSSEGEEKGSLFAIITGRQTFGIMWRMSLRLSLFSARVFLAFDLRTFPTSSELVERCGDFAFLRGFEFYLQAGQANTAALRVASHEVSASSDVLRCQRSFIIGQADLGREITHGLRVTDFEASGCATVESIGNSLLITG